MRLVQSGAAKGPWEHQETRISHQNKAKHSQVEISISRPSRLLPHEDGTGGYGAAKHTTFAVARFSKGVTDATTYKDVVFGGMDRAFHSECTPACLTTCKFEIQKKRIVFVHGFQKVEGSIGRLNISADFWLQAV